MKNSGVTELQKTEERKYEGVRVSPKGVRRGGGLLCGPPKLCPPAKEAILVLFLSPFCNNGNVLTFLSFQLLLSRNRNALKQHIRVFIC